MSKAGLKAAILVVSTTAFKQPSTDASGSILTEVFEKEGTGQWEVVEVKILGDVVLDIQRSVTQWTDQETPVNVIVTTGGTGFAVSDNTPEAITPLLHRQAPGLVHGMLAASLAVTPFALMSRPVAGVRNKTIIITLPGSPKGAKENLQSILKLLPHACLQAAGADSRTLHQGGVKKLEADAGISAGLSAVKDDHQHSHDHPHGHSHSHGHGHHGHAMPIRHTSPNENPLSNDPSQGPTRRYRESPYPLLSVSDAAKLIEQHTPEPRIVVAKVDPSIVGSVVAADVMAKEAVPAYRASIVDGYAVIVSPDSPSSKGTFPVASVSHAQPGQIPPLKPGEIARITTGAPLPPGATSVVMVEETLLKTKTDDAAEEKEVEILTDAIQPGENVREVGSDIEADSTILHRGEQISAIGGELGLLASVGSLSVAVYAKPTIGVLSTGDEIIAHDHPADLHPGEVRDCNRPTILAAVRGWGYDAVDLGVARDQPGALEETMRTALRNVDVVITSGGVSMGELDLLKPTVERSLGGTIHFGRVAMKPGKPTTFATVPVKDNYGERVQKLVFSLPGNPASALVTLHLFVLPALHHFSGVSPAGLPKVMVTTTHDIALDANRAEFHRAVVAVGKDGLLYASSTGGQRSSRVGSLRSANALLCLPTEAGPLVKGSRVEALLMGQVRSGV